MTERLLETMVTELLGKYIWLVQKFITAGDRGLTLEELRTAWERKFRTEYPRRTFNNHREAVAEVFGIEIECDRSSNRYFVRNSGEVSDRDAGISWLIDTFTVNNLLTLSKERLSGRVSVEDIPSGKKHLAPLMTAMQENNIVEIRYRRYGSPEPELRRVHPYGIKESSQRWYLVGWTEERASCRVYALDRIGGLTVLPETFVMPHGFDIDELFSTSFGSYLSDRPAVRVIFKAYGTEASYIKDLPLHHTQTVMKEEEKSTTFSIFVSPNHSLVLEFLRHGANLEVIAPDDLRDEMRAEISGLDNLYHK